MNSNCFLLFQVDLVERLKGTKRKEVITLFSNLLTYSQSILDVLTKLSHKLILNNAKS